MYNSNQLSARDRKYFIHSGNTAFHQRNKIDISRMYQHWSHISFLWGLLWCHFRVAMLFPLKLTIVSSEAETRNISEAELLAQFLLMLYFHPVSHFQSPPLPAVTSGWATAEFTMFETHSSAKQIYNFIVHEVVVGDMVAQSTRSLAHFFNKDVCDSFQSFLKGLLF